MEDDIQNYLSTVMFRGTPAVGELELTNRKWENWSLQIES